VWNQADGLHTKPFWYAKARTGKGRNKLGKRTFPTRSAPFRGAIKGPGEEEILEKPRRGGVGESAG